jgi:hypothetical protein
MYKTKWKLRSGIKNCKIWIAVPRRQLLRLQCMACSLIKEFKGQVVSRSKRICGSHKLIRICSDIVLQRGRGLDCDVSNMWLTFTETFLHHVFEGFISCLYIMIFPAVWRQDINIYSTWFSIRFLLQQLTYLLESNGARRFLFIVFMSTPNKSTMGTDHKLCPIQFQFLFIFLNLPNGIFF